MRDYIRKNCFISGAFFLGFCCSVAGILQFLGVRSAFSLSAASTGFTLVTGLLLMLYSAPLAETAQRKLLVKSPRAKR